MDDRTVRTVAVVLAGGTGARIGLDLPKQLLKIAGKTILEHALDSFETHPQISEIVVVMASGHVDTAEQLIAQGGYAKVSRVIEGGADRTSSTRRAIAMLSARVGPDDDCNVLFHDAVRPLIDQRIITDCVTALATALAVDVAIESADTVIAVSDEGVVVGMPPRAQLRRGQTPQGFRLSVIRQAYERAASDPDWLLQPPTDDCGVVHRYLPHIPIRVVRGSERNMKITHPIDVYVADKLFQLTSDVSVPPLSAGEYRAELEGRTVVIFGGGRGIGADIKAVAEHFGARVWSFSRSETGTHVERPDEVATALRSAAKQTGQVDYVVLTAGVLTTGNLADLDLAAIAETVNVNLLGPATVAKAAQPYLARAHGHLLFYTSSSYTRGRAGYSMYSATKAAVVNLTQALADEWSAAGIRVNCINPERTRTSMRVAAFGEEPPSGLLNSAAVALRSVDVLVSGLTGQVVDVRRADPTRPGARAQAAEAIRHPAQPDRPAPAADPVALVSDCAE
jgi:ribitol-5-phosphate 2-dehydrogenase (NADP+) / D-ribitol-5-phosphate cytidylyltransferase